ncbi:cupin domain-containing protein [Nocardia sp. CA-084685]|uniref:cupin domain-containing protein n=1 Tax=Nocardia sp. CA-084685 TaxID=3239970 RepID=UPI003D97EE42
MDRETDDVLDMVGPRLRALRRDRGITLAERLSSCCSRWPALMTFRWTISSAPRGTGDPRIHLKPIRRFGMVFVPLSRRPGGIQAFKMIIPARPEPLEPTPQTHDGFEWLYVLNGHLRLVLGERDLTLPPGEAAEFDTSLPHWLGSADGGAVELLILFGLQGMRAHVRADRPAN